MGHGGENTVCSPPNHHSSNHYPQVSSGPTTKKPASVTRVNSSGGGGCHNHDKPKGSFSSSKTTKKSQFHSTPQTHSKPINMGKAHSHGKPEYINSSIGNKANLAALQHFQQQQIVFHMMKQQSYPGTYNNYNYKGQLNAAGHRQKSYSPPTLHPMPSRESKTRTVSPALPEGKLKEHFYAGARFETHPSHIGLPVPPSHWTAPLQRSQSQPSSPVPSSLPQKGISVDLATLFGYSDATLKSASFPGERLMDSLVKMEDKRIQKKLEANSEMNEGQYRSLAKTQGTNLEKSQDETDELKKALGLSNFSSSVNTNGKMNACGFNSYRSELSPSTNYQDISDQLKTLLKVAA